jgi:hypothetical protein
MEPRFPSAFRASKAGRDFLVTAGENMSIAPHISGQHVPFGCVTSRRASRAELEQMFAKLREAGRRARET